MSRHRLPRVTQDGAPSPRRGGGRKRKPVEQVRSKWAGFAVTAEEKRMLQQWAKEDGARKMSVWLREQCGLKSS